MALQSKTLLEINNMIILHIESALSQTIPILPKAVWRRVAKALAGSWLVLYKYGTALHRERFVQTASIVYLRYLGELRGVYQQAASTWQGEAEIVCTGSSGEIVAGTQFLKTSSGVVYVVDVTTPITAGTLTLELSSTQSGDAGNLLAGDILDIVSPLPGVAVIATVSAVDISGDDSEDIETYRQRVLNAYQKKPQGGASADYEQWGLEAPNVINIYPYSSTTPGQVDIYVEVDNQVDGIPTSDQLDETELYLIYDPLAGRQTRKPMTAELNMYPISRRIFNLEVIGLDPDNAGNRAIISDTADSWLREKRPYVRALDHKRRDSVIGAEIESLLYTALRNAGAVVSEIGLVDITGHIDFNILSEGELAKLGTVSYI